jgi:SdrD B-like domain
LILSKKKTNWSTVVAGAVLVGGMTGLIVLGIYLATTQRPGQGDALPQPQARPRNVAPVPETEALTIAPLAPNTKPVTPETASLPMPPPPIKSGPAPTSTTQTPRPTPAPIVTAAKPPSTTAIEVAPASTEATATSAKADATPQETERPLPAPASAVANVEPPPYVDQLIEPEGVAGATTEAGEEKPSRYGPGLLGLEYRFFGSDTSGDVNASITEQGVGMTLRQDTLNFGRIDLQTAITDQRQDPGSDFGRGALFRVAQTDLALSERWGMDNFVGDIFALTPPLIALSYRLRLPAPFVRGLATRVTRGDMDFAFSAGDLGIQHGRTFPVFDDATRSGSIAGFTGTYRATPRWNFGLQWWDVTDAKVGDTVSSHTTLAGAAEYHDPVTRRAGQLHMLSNGDGDLGVWLDGELGQGFWQHNFGVFRLDPNLLWIDDTSSIPNDRQGVYWTGNFRKFRLQGTIGVDYSDTNLDDDPTLAGRKTTSSFANVSYQLSRRTSIGGSASFVSQRPGAGLPTPDEDTGGARGTVSHRFNNGTSFWTAGVIKRSGGSDPGTASEFLWDHEWKTVATDRLRTGIEYQRDERSSQTLEQTSLRLSAQRDFGNGRFGLNGNLSVGIGGDGITEDGRSTSINLSFDWRFAQGLLLRTELNWNDNTTELVNGQDLRVTERSAFLSVRYDLEWGQRRASLGVRGAARGYGEINGTVFLDENRNGIQEPNEPGVPNITVYLDRGFSVETDSKGRFTFRPVPAGRHALSVALENVPLPWGRQDERPITVEVSPRGTNQLDFALTKLN